MKTTTFLFAAALASTALIGCSKKNSTNLYTTLLKYPQTLAANP